MTTEPPDTGAGGAPAASRLSTVPILVVDDDPSKMLAVISVLAPLGYRIVTADSGIAALRLISTQDFAVILLDVRMPIMDGFETAALIRMRRQSEMTPIIFVTSHARDEFVTSDVYAQGAVDFIAAPVAPEVLRAKVAVFANLFLRARGLAVKAREVQASADRLRLLTDTAPIGIFQTDADNRYIYTNPRWCELTGLSSTDAAGQQWDVIVDTDRNRDWSTSLMQDSLTGPEFSYRFELGAPDSETRFVLLKSRSLKDDGGVTTGYVGTLSDITAMVQGQLDMADARDKAAAASLLKSNFLATMSHEIRTPMNGVLGMTELLLQTELDAPQRDYAQTLLSSGAALLTVVNDILDFSKIETGKLELEEISFSLTTVITNVVDLLRGLAEDKSLELITEVAPSVPATVTGDPGRFRQILTNLLGNAIKFSAAGSVTVRVSAVPEGSTTVARVEVTDTGIGIAPDKLETIFEPFVQEDTSTTRTHGGTGLGLAISQQLVALMGGEIGVRSQQNVGSTFWFTLVVRTDSADASATQVVPSPPLATRVLGDPPRLHSTSTSPSAGRILLAEDNIINQKVAVAMLSNAGYQVDTVGTGTEAVQAAADGSYAVISMDCRMPELGGFEATAAIRASEGPSRHTPILALTADARHEDRERCLAAGMDDYLSKPISRDALLAMVGKSIQRQTDTPDVA